MTPAPTPPSPARPSIADCAICAALPHKLLSSATDGDEPATPPQVHELATVVRGTSASLLRCPWCATHYYYSRDHSERDICLRASTDVTVRRYGPVAAIEFLGRFAAGGSFPMTAGQFTTAFLDGTQLAADGSGTSDELEAARRELAAVERDYAAIIEDLTQLVGQQPRPAWPTLMHVIESLCGHFCAGADWDALSVLLLRHQDPLVRLAAAALIANTGVRNVSSFDFLHTPASTRAYLEAELARPVRVDELAGVLRAIADAPRAETCEESGAGYRRADSHEVARAALAALERGLRS